MNRNFYLKTDAEAVAGSGVFAAAILASASSYGLTSAQADAFSALNVSLQSAYLASVEPSTRTTVVVAEKNAALKRMRASAISLSSIIRAQPMVTDSMLLGLGLLPRATRTPIARPDAPPRVLVTSVSGRVAQIRVSEGSSSRRGKAVGAASANLYSFIGPEAPADPRSFHFEGGTTRAKTQIEFPNSVPSGATVWLSAAWVNARGQVGPASAPISFNLPGGAVVPSAVAVTAA